MAELASVRFVENRGKANLPLKLGGERDMRRVIAIIGSGLIGLIVLGLIFQVLVEASHNQPFYGVNYKGLNLGTYSTLATLVIAAAIGIVRLAQTIRGRQRPRG